MPGGGHGGDPRQSEPWLYGQIEKVRELVEKLRARIEKLERFQVWIAGIAMGVGGMLGLFADYLKKHLGL